MSLNRTFYNNFTKWTNQVNPKCWRLVSFGWSAPTAWGTTSLRVVSRAVGRCRSTKWHQSMLKILEKLESAWREATNTGEYCRECQSSAGGWTCTQRWRPPPCFSHHPHLPPPPLRWRPTSVACWVPAWAAPLHSGRRPWESGRRRGWSSDRCSPPAAPPSAWDPLGCTPCCPLPAPSPPDTPPVGSMCWKSF